MIKFGETVAPMALENDDVTMLGEELLQLLVKSSLVVPNGQPCSVRFGLERILILTAFVRNSSVYGRRKRNLLSRMWGRICLRLCLTMWLIWNLC